MALVNYNDIRKPMSVGCLPQFRACHHAIERHGGHKHQPVCRRPTHLAIQLWKGRFALENDCLPYRDLGCFMGNPSEKKIFFFVIPSMRDGIACQLAGNFTSLRTNAATPTLGLKSDTCHDTRTVVIAIVYSTK